MKRVFAALQFEIESVLLPFIGSRVILVLVGLLSPLLRGGDQYIVRLAVRRAWEFTPVRLLDMWARWDSAWYYSIAAEGYKPAALGVQSNLAFFPLYPYLIRASNYFLLYFPEHRTTFTFLGVLISNLAFVAALLILANLLRDLNFSKDFTRGTIAIVLISPLSFFFSALLTESLMFFLAVAAMACCIRRKWLLCALVASLAMLARPLGQLIVIPIAISYLLQNKGKLQWKEILPFAMVPLTFFGYLWTLYLISGDWFSILKIRSAWGHNASLPWQTLFHIDPDNVPLSYISIFVVMGMILLCALYIWKYPHKEWGVWGLLMIILPLFTGLSVSIGRYSLIAFPAFIALNGLLENRPGLRQWLLFGFVAMQTLLFMGWVRFYWVG
jgi:hypothetical protein